MSKTNFIGNPGDEELEIKQDTCNYDCNTKYLLSDSVEPLATQGQLIATNSTDRVLESANEVADTSFRVLPNEDNASDQRKPISQTDVRPWSAICSLKIITNRGSFIGTGFFIGERTILTAGHNVFNHEFARTFNKKKFYAKKIRIYPGKYYDSLPFPTDASGIPKPITVNLSKKHTVFVAKEWLDYGEERSNYDYAILRIPQPVGRQTGKFDLGVVDDAFLQNRTVHLAGYPQTVRGDNVAGNLLYHAKNKVTDFNNKLIYHQVDATFGQSGSPIWYQGNNGQPIVIGIYTADLMQSNVGIRITAKLRDNLQKVLS